MKTPGERIKEARLSKGWTQQKLADEISRAKKERISRAAVAQWESGESKTQKPENFFAAAAALGLSPTWVLNESGEKYVRATSSEEDNRAAPVIGTIYPSEPEIAAVVDLMRSMCAAQRGEMLGYAMRVVESSHAPRKANGVQ